MTILLITGIVLDIFIIGYIKYKDEKRKIENLKKDLERD